MNDQYLNILLHFRHVMDDMTTVRGELKRKECIFSFL